ncbi:MAG TPA: FAD-dependent oxidoreductase [Pseudomonadales bacterium]|nr:FAD-dependent oxidoreductase [Pseudomonadales bacterium]
MSRIRHIDALVIGGGVAGLWVLNRLADRGHAVALVEQDRLGAGQTMASQGMIHGGIKYALGGAANRASDAVADMPARWRACIEGRGEIDLRATRRLSDAYWMWSNGGVQARLAALLASKLMQDRVRRLAPDTLPPFFATPEFRGDVWQLPDFVLDAGSLLGTLASHHRGLMVQIDEVERRLVRHGSRFRLEIDDLVLEARTLVLTAGAGNAALLRHLGAAAPRMQRRPLHQVCVEVRHPTPLNAHCITAIRRPEPRLTVTSHPLADDPARPGEDSWLWYLGGAIATTGVTRSAEQQIAFARTELAALVPWVALEEARFTTLRIDRAEPERADHGRPDEAFVHLADGICTAWPTKLSLAPQLGDRVLERIAPPTADSAVRAAALADALAAARRPDVADGIADGIAAGIAA